MNKEILEKLKAILVANTLIEEVYTYEVEQFKGQPAAVIVPSSNESSYYSTKDNERIYAYTLGLFVSRTAFKKYDGVTGGNEKENAEKVLLDLVDTVLDDLDKDFLLAGVTEPTGYNFINMFAVPTNWGYLELEDEYRVATIEIKCRVIVDTSQII